MPSLCHRPALKTRSTLSPRNAAIKVVVVASTSMEYGRNCAQCATSFAPHRLLARGLPDGDGGINMDLLALTIVITAKNKGTQGSPTFRLTGTQLRPIRVAFLRGFPVSLHIVPILFDILISLYQT